MVVVDLTNETWQRSVTLANYSTPFDDVSVNIVQDFLCISCKSRVFHCRYGLVASVEFCNAQSFNDWRSAAFAMIFWPDRHKRRALFDPQHSSMLQSCQNFRRL